MQLWSSDLIMLGLDFKIFILALNLLIHFNFITILDCLEGVGFVCKLPWIVSFETVNSVIFEQHAFLLSLVIL